MRALASAVTALAILAPAGTGPAAIIAARTAPGLTGTLVATGTVKLASPTGREFTLWDGRKFVVPRPPAFVTDELRPGAFVRLIEATERSLEFNSAPVSVDPALDGRRAVPDRRPPVPAGR